MRSKAAARLEASPGVNLPAASSTKSLPSPAAERTLSNLWRVALPGWHCGSGGRLRDRNHERLVSRRASARHSRDNRFVCVTFDRAARVPDCAWARPAPAKPARGCAFRADRAWLCRARQASRRDTVKPRRMLSKLLASCPRIAPRSAASSGRDAEPSPYPVAPDRVRSRKQVYARRETGSRKANASSSTILEFRIQRRRHPGYKPKSLFTRPFLN